MEKKLTQWLSFSIAAIALLTTFLEEVSDLIDISIIIIEKL